MKYREYHTLTHLTSLFPGLPGYEKVKTNVDFTEARDSEWQWYELGHMQVCTSLQTDNHASTPPLSFFTGRMPFLPPNQQCQSTGGIFTVCKYCSNNAFKQQEHPACKNWMMKCWCCYLSGMRCTLFALSSCWCHCIPEPHHLPPHLNPDWFYRSGVGLPRLSWKRGH